MSSAQKKTPDSPSPGTRRRREYQDQGRERYEALRRSYVQSGCQGRGELWERFSKLGLYGLIRSSEAEASYVVEVYEAPTPRWCGRTEPEERALEVAYRLLTQGLVIQQNQGDEEHASRIVRTGFQQSSGEEGDDSFAARSAAQIRQRTPVRA